MFDELHRDDLFAVLGAAGTASKEVRGAWVSVDEVIEVLMPGPSPTGWMWAKGLDQWNGLKRLLRQLEHDGFVELHVGAATLVPFGQPTPIAGPDDIEVTEVGWAALDGGSSEGLLPHE